MNIHPDILGNINPTTRKLLENEAERVNIAKGVIESYLKGKHLDYDVNISNNNYRSESEKSMKHLKNVREDIFFKKPVEFNKYSDRDLLQYALGANLYMNGLRDIFDKLTLNGFEDVGSITICFEDATKESDLNQCEENTLNLLSKLYESLEMKMISIENLPLIFIRVRNEEQFINFTERLSKEQISLLAGFIFPKFNCDNGQVYLNYLQELNYKFNEKLYGMPILESEKIIYKESRIDELLNIKKLLSKYHDLILNIRVGGTDFSSKFALRRGVSTSIYDIRVVSECLIDIVNVFGRREDGYVISAPVWEYFSTEVESKEVQGLIKEITYDKENGFCGKTIIHPSQGRYVNSIYAVTYEEYVDARNILTNQNEGGVFKGCGDNKMNEVLPHLNWAKKINCRAKAFGVLNKGITHKKIYLQEKDKQSVVCLW